MAPVDVTPSSAEKSFELLHSLRSYDKIPVSEYKSKKTGLTVVVAEVEGPIVNGFFCVVTEAHDDDGLPHTLEHLIFLGSEKYPYKGVLDLLANRCLASGTNAWTDTDHTCYTMETAGAEGFLALMPIYVEHILFPVLSEEGFTTEVHHITPKGDDAGVVYCEMQGRENSADSRMHLNMGRAIYPGKCGYKSETGGIMKNLRESTTNDKVRKYHKEFYRPENLKLVITGQIKAEDIFRALAPIEDKILSSLNNLPPFERPWQSPVPALTESKELKIPYPSDDEDNGQFTMAWRGPSAVTEYYTLTALGVLLKHFTQLSVSPLQQHFVEIDDPYASTVSYYVAENSESMFAITFEDVPLEKLPEVGSELKKVLKQIVDEENIDMTLLRSIIQKNIRENLYSVENQPHYIIAHAIIGHMLYGNNKKDLEERVNPLTDLKKILNEPKEYWISLIKKYLIEANYVSIECIPSKNEKTQMVVEEKNRVEEQIQKLLPEGLKLCGEKLEKAIEYNERPPPPDMLTSVPIPGLEGIKFHPIERYSSLKANPRIDLSKTATTTYFDHLNSNFVYISCFMDTGAVPEDLRVYLPLLLELLPESPISRDGKIIPYEEVVAQLSDDTVEVSGQLGIGNTSTFRCGDFSQTAELELLVEASKYQTGLGWLQSLLYNTVFTVERMKQMATKMKNSIAQAKRSGRDVVSLAINTLNFRQDTNLGQTGFMVQNKFLTEILEALEGPNAQKIVDNIEKVRNIISNPDNYVIYLAGSLDLLKDPVEPLLKLIPGDKKSCPLKSLQAIPEYKLLKSHEEGEISGCVIGLGCLESSYFYQCTKGVTSVEDSDFPALLLYAQYLCQAEGPMWRTIRGKGFSYGYTIRVEVNKGLLYLVFAKATNVVGAYKEARDIVVQQTTTPKWDQTLLDAARSSLIFEIIDTEKTPLSVMNMSITSYFQNVDFFKARALLKKIGEVTVEDLNKVGQKYLNSLFDPKKTKTACVIDCAKAEEISKEFKAFDLDLKVYPSLEESFLKC